MMTHIVVEPLKLTAKAAENQWSEDEFPFGFRFQPILMGELLHFQGPYIRWKHRHIKEEVAGSIFLSYGAFGNARPVNFFS